MPEPSKTETRISRLRSERTRLISIGLNLVRGDRYESHMYLLPSGRTVVVRILCQMEK
jgi:hypothetical protein